MADTVLGKADPGSPVSAGVPFTVTLTGVRKAIESIVGYVDLWTKGTGWPRGEEPIAAIHWTGVVRQQAEAALRLMLNRMETAS